MCLPVGGLCNYNSLFGNEEILLDPWNTLNRFINLEYLEITGFWKDKTMMVPFTGKHNLLLELKSLKLRGYLSADFVRSLRANAPNLIDLQLGVIDEPIVPREYRSQASYEDEDQDEDMEDDDSENLDDADIIAPRPLACLSPGVIANMNGLRKLSLIRPCEGLEGSFPHDY